MSSIRLSGTSSGYYDLTVPAVAGTNSIDLSNLPSKTNLGTSSITHGSNTGDTRFTLNSANQYTLRIQNAGNIAGQIGGGGADDLRFSNAAGATTMQIKDGSVVAPSQPSFLMKKYTGGGTAIAVNSVWTYDEALTNVGGHANISNGRFTAPVAGNYCFMWHNIGMSSGSTVYRSFIRKNSSGLWGSGSYRLESRNFHSGGYPNASAQAVVALAATDYVDIYLEGGAVYSDQTNGAWFCGFLIG